MMEQKRINGSVTDCNGAINNSGQMTAAGTGTGADLGVIPAGMEESQVKAIIANPSLPLCVFAGPGSGKTAVIMERLKYLNSVTTTKCLVLTFSKSAVNEMTNRLKQQFGNLKNIEICTFHSFSFRLVIKLWQMLGFPSKPKIAKNYEAKKLFRVRVELAFVTGSYAELFSFCRSC
jgi:DNA helicase-2/ATP-dependent DNA helicase PcrA